MDGAAEDYRNLPIAGVAFEPPRQPLRREDLAALLPTFEVAAPVATDAPFVFNAAVDSQLASTAAGITGAQAAAAAVVPAAVDLGSLGGIVTTGADAALPAWLDAAAKKITTTAATTATNAAIKAGLTALAGGAAAVTSPAAARPAAAATAPPAGAASPVLLILAALAFLVH